MSTGMTVAPGMERLRSTAYSVVRRSRYVPGKRQALVYKIRGNTLETVTSCAGGLVMLTRLTRCASLGVEPVSDAGLGADVVPPCRSCWIDLCPEPSDMGPQHLDVVRIAGPPDLGEEHRGRLETPT